MMTFFCITGAFLLALIPHIIWVLGWIVTRFTGTGILYRPFGFTALALVSIFLCVMSYGYHIGRWKVQTTEMEYAHPEIPAAFDGFRIVHISDLHLSTFDDDRERFMTFVNEINRLSPDIVCFTGDMVTIGKIEAEPYTDLLRQIHAEHGVLSVLGNHDFMIYGFRNRSDSGQAVEELALYQEETLGWHLLRNESITITADDSTHITFLGVDNANFGNQGFRTIHRGDLSKAMEGTDGFRILLTHDPSHWTAEVIPKTDIPLTLSGHTHSAQVRIFGWTPAKWSFKETYGRYDNEGQTLYINIGLGCTAPVRIGANPEVTLITLRKGN